MVPARIADGKITTAKMIVMLKLLAKSLTGDAAVVVDSSAVVEVSASVVPLVVCVEDVGTTTLVPVVEPRNEPVVVAKVVDISASVSSLEVNLLTQTARADHKAETLDEQFFLADRVWSVFRYIMYAAKSLHDNSWALVLSGRISQIFEETGNDSLSGVRSQASLAARTRFNSDLQILLIRLVALSKV